MSTIHSNPGSRAALSRGAGLFVFWLLLSRPGAGTTPELAGDLTVGLVAAALATWASLRLSPPTPGRLRFRALARFALHFVWQSIVAGVDVARRAFDPRLPLKPGYLAYPVRLPPGPKRDAFGAVTSLMPGTLPVGTDTNGALVYHCLDMDQPVAANLSRDEALLTRVRRRDADHD
ncbi:MAG TPA: Na+/H+ antiporter subunit E [Lamprocystis sp. (in: g-proteobacteria)]|nr:Na+/H+ antiporter subunit E [Lamprocystis sp. (in: g-proteobacteria)]